MMSEASRSLDTAVPGLTPNTSTRIGVIRAPSPWDVWDAPAPKKPIRQLPHVTWSAIRFVWDADRRSLALTLANDLAAGVASGAQVLVVAALLSRLIGNHSAGQAARSAAPWV